MSGQVAVVIDGVAALVTEPGGYERDIDLDDVAMVTFLEANRR